MLTEKETIKGEAIFNETRTHRFVLKRTWNKAKPQATVIMLNPCDADSIICDTTTFLVINNIARLEEFGGVTIVNLFSLLTSKLSFKWCSDEELNLPENNDYIKKAAEESSKVILAWGRAVDTNRRIEERAMHVLNLLLPYREKLFLISDGDRVGLHPLTPAVRNRWILEHFDDASERIKQKKQEKLKEAKIVEEAIPVEVDVKELEQAVEEGEETITEIQN